jgi:hypothetical protein
VRGEEPGADRPVPDPQACNDLDTIGHGKSPPTDNSSRSGRGLRTSSSRRPSQVNASAVHGAPAGCGLACAWREWARAVCLPLVMWLRAYRMKRNGERWLRVGMLSTDASRIPWPKEFSISPVLSLGEAIEPLVHRRPCETPRRRCSDRRRHF